VRHARTRAHTHKSLVEHNSVLLLHSNLPKADRLIHIYKAVKYANPRNLRQTGLQEQVGVKENRLSATVTFLPAPGLKPEII
jgi:hypothetical protein